MDKIIVKIRGSVVRDIPLSDAPNAEYCMGRDLQSQVVIEDQKASRRHVILSKKNGRYFLRDLGSTNGSYLNEQEMLAPNQDREIFHGDVLTIGDHALQFDFPSLSGTVSDGGEDLSPISNATLPMMGGGTMRIGSIDEPSPAPGQKGALSQEVHQAVQRLKAHLLVVLSDTREVYEINEPELVIGREPSNDICIAHHSISGRHAKFQFGSGRFAIEDLRSTNGTMVNGNLIHKQSIGSPSVIVFGDVLCLFSTENISSNRDSQDKLLKQVGKNLVGQGFLSKKQLRNSMRETQGSSIREFGETLILNGIVDPDQWMQAITGEKGKKGSEKKSLLPTLILFCILVIGALAAGVFYLSTQKAKKAKATYAKAQDLSKKAKNKRDLASFEESEKAFKEALALVESSELKSAVKLDYAKMLKNYGKILLSKNKVEEAMDKLKSVFATVSEKAPLYKETALLICRYYIDKAVAAKDLEIKIKYYEKILEAQEEDLGFETRLLEKEDLYKKLCLDLSKIYFFQAVDYFKDKKYSDADNLWTKKVRRYMEPYPQNPYYGLAEIGHFACLYMQSSLAEEESKKQEWYEKFTDVWEKMTARHPEKKLLKLLSKDSGKVFSSLVFKERVEKDKAK